MLTLSFDLAALPLSHARETRNIDEIAIRGHDTRDMAVGQETLRALPRDFPHGIAAASARLLRKSILYRSVDVSEDTMTA